jgi:hypothetical protein
MCRLSPRINREHLVEDGDSEFKATFVLRPQPSLHEISCCLLFGHCVCGVGQRPGSGDGEREATITRQGPYDPLPAFVLFALGFAGLHCRFSSLAMLGDLNIWMRLRMSGSSNPNTLLALIVSMASAK